MTVHEQTVQIHVGVDIGCLECGEESAIVAVATDKVKVQRALRRAEKRQQEHWHGQHSFELFSVPLKLSTPVEAE